MSWYYYDLVESQNGAKYGKYMQIAKADRAVINLKI